MRRPDGIYPILYAFWGEDGRLDEAQMARQVEHCLAHGAHGIAVLGLVTEANKMEPGERRALIETVGDRIAGRAPYAVTVGGASAKDQIAFARAAARAGADWVILQPPAAPGMDAPELVRFFGRVADALDMPVAVQNNPVNLDVSLSPADLVELNRAHPNIAILKGEGWSVDIARVIDGSDGAFTVFGGHGGIEFPALLRSGGRGLIPAPDFLPAQRAMWDAWMAGDVARAEAVHRRILPAIVFMSRSVPGMLCYGKRLFAGQADITPVRDRSPALAPTAFGQGEIERFAAAIAQAVTLDGSATAAE